MYVVSGANLHGQWFYSNYILNGFQNISKKKSEYIGDIDRLELIHSSWSYNIFKDTENFYLAGSWNGKNRQIIVLPFPKQVIKENILISGNDYSLFLFENNSHIMWVINLEDSENVKRVNLKTEIPCSVKRMKGDHSIVKVCVSNFYCICLAADGSMYSGLLPGPLDVSGCIGKVCDIQSGYEHYLLLTDTGQVYSWGNGRRLQLGHGDLSNIETPKEIEALSGINITMIRAGGWHSLALSEFGDLYAWGWNDTGQLGIKEVGRNLIDQSDNQSSGLSSHGLPTLVDIYDENGDVVNSNVKHISCGNLHSAIILENNSVWTAGCNKYGQLGFATETIEKVHYFKKSYQCFDKSLIKCGPWVTVIVTKLQHTENTHDQND